MPSTLERRLSLSIQGDQHNSDYQEKWTQSLVGAGFTHDLTSDSVQKSLLHTESLTGTAWYPGYYEKWFFTGLAYKEHDTFVGYDDNLGYICISVLLNSPTILNQPEPTCTRALVRSKIGFLGLVLSNHTDSQSPSKSPQKRLAMPKKTSNSQNMKSILKEVLTQYLEQIKRVSGRSSPYADSSLDSLASSRSSLSETDFALKRWLYSRESIAFDRIHVDKIVNSFDKAPFPAIARKLHDLERPSKTITYEIDIIRAGQNEASQQWTDLIYSLGELHDTSVQEKKEEKKVTRKTKEERKSKRDYLLKEFLETESNYVSKLKIILEKYETPLREKKILNNMEMGILFTRLQSLYDSQVAFLKKLKTEGSDIFDACAEHFNSSRDFYKSYINGQDDRRKLCAELLEKNKSFMNFVKETQSVDKSMKLSLTDLLIEPIQRPPRYELYLKEILGASAPDDAHFEQAQLALAAAKKLNEYMNSNKAIQDLQIQLLSLKQEIENLPDDVIKSSRYLIACYEGSEIDIGQNHNDKHCKIFLLSDSILVASVKAKLLSSSRDKKVMVFKDFFELSKINLISLKDMGLDGCFQIEAEVSTAKKDVIKLGDEQNSSSHMRKSFNNLNYSLSLALQQEEETYRKTFTFKIDQPDNFMKNFRKAQDVIQPRNYVGGRIFYKWTDYNAEFVFHVYNDIKQYQESERKNRLCTLVVENSKTSHMKLDLDADISCVILCDHNQFKAIFRGNDMAVKSNPNSVKRNHPLIREAMWKPINDSFAENLLPRLKRLGDILRFNDHEVQIMETERIRSRLHGIVQSYVQKKSTNLDSFLTKSSMILQKPGFPDGFKSLHSLTLKVRSRTNSVSSLADSAVGDSSRSLNANEKLEGLFSVSPRASESSVESGSKASLVKNKSIFRRLSMNFGHFAESKRSPAKRPRNVALMVKTICNYLELNCIETDRIYQIVAPSSSVEMLSRKFKGGSVLEIELQQFEAHAIACAFRQWVEENQALIGLQSFRNFIWSIIQDCKDGDYLDKIKSQLTQGSNLFHLNEISKDIFRHLKLVVDNEALNFTSLEKLSQSWSHIIFSGSPEDLNQEIGKNLFMWTITNLSTVFAASINNEQSAVSLPVLPSEEERFWINPASLAPRRSLDALMDKDDVLNRKSSQNKTRKSLISISETEVQHDFSDANSISSRSGIPPCPETFSMNAHIDLVSTQLRRLSSISGKRIPRKPVNYEEQADSDAEVATLYESEKSFTD